MKTKKSKLKKLISHCCALHVLFQTIHILEVSVSGSCMVTICKFYLCTWDWKTWTNYLIPVYGTLYGTLKSRDITLSTKVRLVKAMVFPVVMYGCENWTVKKAEYQRIDAFELWCWRRLLRVPWTARRSNQSILKEISPGCSLEGLMLKLQLQYFGHLMWRADSLEKTLMLEGLGAGGEGDNRGWDGWMASPTQWTWVWVNSRSWWWTGSPGVLWFMGLQRVRHGWVTELIWYTMNCILREGILFSDESSPETLMILLSKIIPLKKIDHKNHSQTFLLNNGKTTMRSDQIRSVVQSCPTLCNPMNHSTPGLPPCPSPTPGVHWDSSPLIQWCYPAISSSVIPFSSCPQSLPASESFPMSQLFAWGGQSTGVSALASFLPKKPQGWSPLEWTGWISLQSKALSRVFSNSG